MIVKHFTLGDLTMRKPRREFNDLPVLNRAQVDRMAFNMYQPNDGDPLEGNETTAWRSNAQRPIVRNKAISIAAHSTARLIFPKVFAYNKDSDEQRDAAQVMEDLMEWAGDKSDYVMTGLKAVINALIEPASIVYTEYGEVYRDVKRSQEDGKWKVEKMLDENMSGFQDTVVPCDELYIENFYEHDLQKQGWLIWRRVHSYDLMSARYGSCPNFKYVTPGVQTIYDDANRLFYEVYDSNMRQYECEEVLYWNKSLDLYICMVNGVMMTSPDNPNPRRDKNYPFVKFGYELVDGGRCFYYKSLVSKMLQDAKVLNTLYQMVIDGTFLQLFPPMVNRGGEIIGSDVLIPGAVATLSSPDADLKPLTTANNIGAGINALMQVEKSINDTSMDQFMQGGAVGNRQSAYSLSIMQQNANTLLGPFVQMISLFVKDFGKLRMSDIIQYLSIGNVNEIEGDAGLVYKSFLLHNKTSGSKNVTRKIKFDASLPTEPMTEMKKLKLSYDTKEEGAKGGDDVELYRVNPPLFRDLYYMVGINPDILNPMSDELEKQYGLEEYDRMIQHPEMYDPKETGLLLLDQFKSTKKNPERFLNKQISQPNPTNPMQMLMNGGAPGGAPGGMPGMGGPVKPPMPTTLQQISP
jgi:hypothetical protein